jgi:pimeloyl-ACP methyl ester carboxylesterase
MDNVQETASCWGKEGKVLIFLHYFGGAASSWQWVANELESDYRCIALNIAEFGSTPALHQYSLQHYADAVKAQLQQLKIKSYTLIGHSMGGKIALQMAANQSPGLQHVILIAPSPPTPEPMPPEEKERLLENHLSRESAETTIKHATRRALSDEQYEFAIETHRATDQNTWRWWLLEGIEENIANQMQRIQVPVTVIASKDDPVIPYETIQSDVIGLIEEAQLVAIENVGHLIPLEAPKLVADHIRGVTLSA